MNYNYYLEDILKNIEKTFDKNELAYLTLTSKVENVLRDKVAFEFHKLLGNTKLVCREWTNNRNVKLKSDIAILNYNSKPEYIIEFKAHSSVTGIGQWAKTLIYDYKKNIKLYKEAEIVYVLFANFVSEIPNNEIFENSIKYYSSIKKSTQRNYTIEFQSKDWKKALEKKSIDCELIEIKLNAGKFDDKLVTINTFIHKNIKI